MKRLAFLLVFLLLCTFTSLTFATGTGATALPDHVTLTWSGDPATTMTITWRTDTTVTTGSVQYQSGSVLNNKTKEVTAVSRDFTTDLGAARLFTVTLTGLAGKTTYTYRVGSGEHWSNTHTFSTADPRARAIKFLVFGDSQSSVTDQAPYALWRATVHNAFNANPDARFMVNMGDLVDTGQSGAHWNAWFAAAADVIDTIPEMAVQGNHEDYGSKGTTKPAYWIAQFALPQNGPANLKDQVYSYNCGPVHFVVLDSQQDEEQGDIFTPQKAWLNADLAASKATWKIVFFHKTPYDIKANRVNPAVKAAFCPTMEQHHVDLVFNGHDHGVARTFPIKGDAFMRKPSQGTIYFITGRSGGKTYSDLQKKEWNTYFYNPLDQPIYLVVEVTTSRLTVKTLKQDGTLLDTFFIDKTQDVDSDIQQQPAAIAAPAGATR